MKIKDQPREPTTPVPSLAKEGNCELSSSDEEGVGGWWGFATFAHFAARR